jgi:sarcosine oxidase / L-pipecolate oxidase
VDFVAGSPEGNVVKLIYSIVDVLGVVIENGIEHRTDRTIIVASVNAPQIFDFKNQLRPTAWIVALIPMTGEEAKLYKNLPVLFNIEKGFFIEPDEDKQEVKLCEEHPGYCNWRQAFTVGSYLQSVPVAKHEIPTAAA